MQEHRHPTPTHPTPDSRAVLEPQGAEQGSSPDGEQAEALQKK